jgi:hypothetical protein
MRLCRDIDASSMVCGLGGVHSLDELSVVRCSFGFVRTGILKPAGC